MSDFELLRRYARERRQEAFAEIVSRYVNLVYSAALRQMGDHHRAEDVTQAVFIVLARKAHSIGEKVMLGGWLLRTTGFAVRNLLRDEKRRKSHEKKAAPMNPIENDVAKTQAWEQIGPLLDEGIRRLPVKARDAVILRFLEERSPQDVAKRLGISEEAARQRVSRAVELLREYFARRGAVVPAAVVAVVMLERAVQVAPGALAVSAASAAATATPLSNGVLAMILMSKIKAVAVMLLVVSLFGAVTAAVLRAGAGPSGATPPAGAQPAAAGGDGNQTEMEISGALIGPDGQPLANAEVFLADRDHPVYPYGDVMPQQAMVRTDDGIPLSTYYDRKPANQVATTSGADGRFSFKVPLPPSKRAAKLVVPIEIKPGSVTTPAVPNWKADPIYQIVVRDEKGFAQVFVDDLPRSREILVSPWGRIEGVMKMGERPVAGETIYLSRWPRMDDQTLFNVVHDLTARTDAEGKFVFPRLSAGDVWITRRVRQVTADVSHFAYVDVEAGKTAQVRLGGGRMIIGKMMQPKDAREAIIWQDRTSWTQGEVTSVPAHPFERPADWYNLTSSQRAARMAEWGRSKAGLAFKNSMFKISFLVGPDGMFSIPDLAPGDYELKARTSEGSEAVASVERALTVDAAGKPGEALDLGTLEVKVEPRIRVGDVAPQFECKTVNGAPLKLANYQGKYVLLCFADTGMPKELIQLDELKAIRSAYARDERLAIVSLYTDPEATAAKKFVETHGLDWAQGHIGTGSKIQTDYHANGQMIFLIGPDGKVVGRNLARERLAGALREALGKGPK